MDWLFIGPLAFFGIVVSMVLIGFLARSNARLRAERRITQALANTRDGFFVLDRHCRFAFANQRAADILGTGSGILCGKSLQEVLPDGSKSALYVEITRAFEDWCSVRFEHFHPAVNRWFEHQVSPGVDSDVAVFSRDITARRRLEDALRASEDRFGKLIDSNIIGVLVTRSELVMEANDRFLDMIGYSREALLLRQINYREITPVEFSHLDEKARAEMLQTGACAPFEKEFACKDGSHVPVLICATLIGNSPAEALFLVQDLSERKRSERLVSYIVNASRILESSLDDEQLHQDLANFVVEDIAEACMIFTREDNKLRRMAAAASNSEIGNALREVEADKATVLLLEQVLQTGQSALLPGLGWPKIRSCALVPLPARSGGAGGLVLTSSVENAFAEDDLHMLEELGRRTGTALENARLYKHAQEANRLKDEFVAIVSHELRTPLTPILGAVYMLRNERYDERVFNRALDLIERNAKAQAKIVEDLLDLSRILSGKLRLNWEFVDMESVIYAAIDTVRPASEAKGIQIKTDLDPFQNTIRGDTDRLQQVIWNLLANSVKFTPKGGRITIELKETDIYAEIRVIDTGIGIGAEFLPFVFERFRQENASRTRIHGGLGLGLAIVRHLVESHGGTVQAQSSGDKQGSTFVVRLPLRLVHDTARAVHAGD